MSVIARNAATRPILVTGRSGQLGHELLRCLAPFGAILAVDRDALNLASPDDIRKVVRDATPRMIVNAAAYTAVDAAEEEGELAYAVNAVAPGILAEEASRIGAGLVHFSTDYVFDGATDRPYRETDLPSPLNVYGASKLAGERAIAAHDSAAIVLRTSWVYGLRGRNFLMTIQDLARKRELLTVVDDQYGAPTWSRMLAQITSLVLGKLDMSVERMREFRGIYHVAGGGATSWCGFARAIVSEMTPPVATRIEGIPSSEYPSRATRPSNSVLDTSLLASTFGLNLPDWRNTLAQVMRDQASMAR